MCRGALEDDGYELFVTGRADVALEFAAETKTPIDLAIIDVWLAEMGGAHLAKILRLLQPGLLMPPLEPARLPCSATSHCPGG